VRSLRAAIAALSAGVMVVSLLSCRGSAPSTPGPSRTPGSPTPAASPSATLPASATPASTTTAAASPSPALALDGVEALPPPRLSSPLSLEEVLQARRSVRSFSDAALTAAEVGQLLWAAQGVTDASGHRTAPSAGALYPLEVDVVCAAGIARYEPDGHRLTWRGSTDVRAELQRAALDQASIGEAPVVIVLSGVVERTAGKYGGRAERYVILEAGHTAQNILLEAVSLGLGAVPMGAFDDGAVSRVVGLARGEAPLYLIPVGHPR
jgi:SagB-type dehydrogenase family enzyme